MKKLFVSIALVSFVMAYFVNVSATKAVVKVKSEIVKNYDDPPKTEAKDSKAACPHMKDGKMDASKCNHADGSKCDPAKCKHDGKGEGAGCCKKAAGAKAGCCPKGGADKKCGHGAVENKAEEPKK